MAESWKNLKDTITFSSFSICSNRNRSALVCHLLSTKSQFVGQLYRVYLFVLIDYGEIIHMYSKACA